MSEATLLESRVGKIERDNRRLKLTVGALLLALAAVPLIGAVMPQQIPEEIRARNFIVEGENGTIRAFMNANAIGYHDEDGNAVMNADSIGYWDENGGAMMTDNGISYYDENGTVRALMSAGGIWYSDENDNIVWSTMCAPNC